MDDTAGSRTESAESQPRDSDSASKAVDRDTIPIQENESSQQSTPDSDRPKRRIAIGTQRTDSVTEQRRRHATRTSRPRLLRLPVTRHQKQVMYLPPQRKTRRTLGRKKQKSVAVANQTVAVRRPLSLTLYLIRSG